jgi:hypothetical protein
MPAENVEPVLIPVAAWITLFFEETGDIFWVRILDP